MERLNENFGGGYETPDLRVLSVRSENGFCNSNGGSVKTSTIDDITDDEDVINF